MKYDDAATEHINRDTFNIDIVGTHDILTMINNEDMKVALAVKKSIPQIAKGVDIIVRNFCKEEGFFTSVQEQAAGWVF